MKYGHMKCARIRRSKVIERVCLSIVLGLGRMRQVKQLVFQVVRFRITMRVE